MTLISVEEALEKVLASARRLGSERIDINQALGRTLAAPLKAKRTQPPFNASAMDGYAVRGDDVARSGALLRVIGESAAGHGFSGLIGAQEAVRIFTGAPVPEGADTILLQEHAKREGDLVSVIEPEQKGRHVRSIGLDFAEGHVLLPQGHRLNARSLALAAAMNHE